MLVTSRFVGHASLTQDDAITRRLTGRSMALAGHSKPVIVSEPIWLKNDRY